MCASFAVVWQILQINDPSAAAEIISILSWNDGARLGADSYSPLTDDPVGDLAKFNHFPHFSNLLCPL